MTTVLIVIGAAVGWLAVLGLVLGFCRISAESDKALRRHGEDGAP